MYVISSTLKVFLQTEKHIDTYPLVWLHDIVKHVVGSIEEDGVRVTEILNDMLKSNS